LGSIDIGDFLSTFSKKRQNPNPLTISKTFFWSVVATSSAITATQGSCDELTQETKLCCTFRPSVEFKTGYFFFSNSKMRKTYDKGGLDIQLCASYPFWSMTRRWSLSAYGAVEYFQRSGKSISGHEKTSIWSVPVNIGLKPVYAIQANLQYYFAIGPRYFYIHQHNHSPYVSKNASRNGIGFFVNTGFNYFLAEHLVIDVFGEYSYAQVHFHSRKSGVYTKNMQVGGFTFGGGIGYKF
jgi:outer membrane protein W